jgi:hypothetical protein
MQKILALTLLLATFALPAFAADAKVPVDKPPVEIEMPEIIIQMPAAKFEQAIVRDNEEPVVLLLV